MLSLQEVIKARETMMAVVHRTPLVHSRTLSEMTGADVWLKLENLQRTGSFKIRGALNKIASLSEEERKRGVVAASAGNHAQGVALAAGHLGVRATVVMPREASIAKVEATRRYGAEVVLHGANYNDAQDRARELEKERGLVFVHAFEDEKVIAGQGTLGLEIIEELPELETLVCPIGGGGLISGVAAAVKAKKPGARIVGVQPEGSATVPQSLKEGRVVRRESIATIADGLATKQIGEITFGHVRSLVDEAVTVDEAQIASAILLLLERCKTLVEGAGAVSVAALVSGKVKLRPGENVVALLSGGNIDITLLDRILNRGLQQDGRVFRFWVTVPDKPGQLSRVLDIVAESGASVRQVVHERFRPGLGIQETEIGIEVETKGDKHIAEMSGLLQASGFRIRTGPDHSRE
ncbi:MAG TPA: threonine ammonia-lyase [Thermoplasmata archaeon]|nr:threonine ammonia-lyase [Thermoplasmata archaeon]